MEILIWAICFNLMSVSVSNQFDPHVYPSVGPFFEGWYMRLIDFSTNNSYGLLFGHVLSIPSTNSSYPKVLASLLHRSHCTNNNTYKLYSSNVVCLVKDLNVTVRNGPVIKNPDDKSPPHFTWQTPFGLFTQTNNITTFHFDFGNYIFRGRIGPPVPWGPDGEGPEGWIDKLPFIPLHWFVFSLRSRVIWYELLNVQTGQRIEGTNGVVHMEKNWGNSFPKGWIWSQGVSSHDNISFALSGGLVSLGEITTTQYLIGYRNIAKNLNLNYRPGNAKFSATHNGCVGWFKIKVYGLLHEIHLSASADLSTFSDCLYGPEITGFRQACIESYDAIIYITVFKREFLSLKKIDSQIIKLSALEFGGTYTCDKQCHLHGNGES